MAGQRAWPQVRSQPQWLCPKEAESSKAAGERGKAEGTEQMRCLEVKGTCLLWAGRAVQGAPGLQSVAWLLIAFYPQLDPEPQLFQEVTPNPLSPEQFCLAPPPPWISG